MRAGQRYPHRPSALKELAESPRLERVLARVMELDGNWDRVFGGVLIIHLPRDCPYDPMAGLNRDA